MLNGFLSKNILENVGGHFKLQYFYRSIFHHTEFTAVYGRNRIQNWKKVFLANASLAFNADAAVAAIKDTVNEQNNKIDELHRQLGKRTAELEWASKKLQSLDFKTKETLIRSDLGGISIAVSTVKCNSGTRI